MLHFSDIQIPCLLESGDRPWRSRSARGPTVSVLVRCVPSVCEAPKKQLFISAHEREREREGESENPSTVLWWCAEPSRGHRIPKPSAIKREWVSLLCKEPRRQPCITHAHAHTMLRSALTHTHKRAQQLVASRALPRRRRCGLDSSAAFLRKRLCSRDGKDWVKTVRVARVRTSEALNLRVGDLWDDKNLTVRDLNARYSRFWLRDLTNWAIAANVK